MSLYFIKTPNIIKRIFSNYIWSQNKTTTKKVYLTFDDGPTQDITNWVLSVLKENNAKATFFCVGNNIEKNKNIVKEIAKEGHAIGNHTYNHLNGWKTRKRDYLNDIAKNELLLNEFCKTKLFRPPYGKIKNSQANTLIKKGYKIIMWDVLSADFDNITKEKCYENVIKNVTNGSIVVFHDSIKAKEKLKYTLPKAIKHLKSKGYKFEAIY